MEEPGLIDYSSDKKYFAVDDWERRKFHPNIENECRPFFDPSLEEVFLKIIRFGYVELNLDSSTDIFEF